MSTPIVINTLRDYYRWRRAFAFFPTRINGTWVWWEHFSYRYVQDIDSMGAVIERRKAIL